MTSALEDYAIIGDGRTAALVCKTGSIDWLCWPYFDSSACFSSLLGDTNNGYWKIAPTATDINISRRYRNDTLVLETDFECASGAIRVIDFMPVDTEHSALVRIVEGLRGEVEILSSIRICLDYGSLLPWTCLRNESMIAEAGPNRVILRAPGHYVSENGITTIRHTALAGESIVFSLTYGSSHHPVPPPIDAEGALAATQRYWTEWISTFTKKTEWPDAVRRSLITLKCLIFTPSGGLIAAPTTSLPETPGGNANWDYRFCWLRDSTFTLTAFLNAGFTSEARAWRDWAVQAIGPEPAQMRIMYRIDGSRHIPEWETTWLSGYNWSKPVRVGNAASKQYQADVYGEVIDAFYLATKAGIEPTERSLQTQIRIIENIAKTWQKPGSGLWESRGELRHYVYARAMAWVGIDRCLKDARLLSLLDKDTIADWAHLRSRIHAEVCEEGYHPGLGRFVDYYGGQEIDASLLLLPLIGFLPIDDPRITATIDAVAQELSEQGFIRRQIATDSHPEGAFLACSLWLADCRIMQGDTKAARSLVERVLAIRNDVGLLSEEYNVPGRRLAGNFPQALSHLALVTTIMGLSGPILQRAGG